VWDYGATSGDASNLGGASARLACDEARTARIGDDG